MSQDENNTNASTLRAFYDAIFSNDWAAIGRLVTDDLVIYEADGLPYRGVYHGIEQLQSLFGTVVSYWNDLKISVVAVTSGEGYAIGLLQFEGVAKASGTRVSMPVAEVTQFKEGRICSIKPIYWDTQLIAQVVKG
ncbi:nuclear transport factor 2 family protein [Pseudomonas abietaniphila]|uniref:nuclear transport factor 2 family protein n=1 Tax=Pseudomonas abietaniphila TaxID=89065 RepID=UPI000783CCF5|nr:nuclear transport factor 2 family protein [Pseudomonas abietaniphila]